MAVNFVPLNGSALADMARQNRIDTARMFMAAGNGHFGSCYSCTDIVTVVYFALMRVDRESPDWPSRDRFLLSKGRAAPTLYSALIPRGFFPEDWIDGYESRVGSRLMTHPSRRYQPGVDASLGALGHGRSIGLGMVLAGQRGADEYATHVLMGDYKINEGSVWEAAMAAAKFGLGNLVGVVDSNKLYVDGRVADVMPMGSLEDKWLSFGWDVTRVDGHDLPALQSALAPRRGERLSRPRMVIADTIKGKGVHGECSQLAFGCDHAGAVFRAAVRAWRSEMTIADARAGLPMKSIRQQYGETFMTLTIERDDFIFLTADLMFATGMDAFGTAFPDRLINMGIAEQNMTGVAAGPALAGRLPIVCGYAAFTTLRAIEQAKLDAACNAVKVILTGQSAGRSYGVGGPTHQSLEDVAIMRAIPGMIVLVPSDAREVDACLWAALRHPVQAPIYIRPGRGPEWKVPPPDSAFVIGQAVTLREGCDLTLIANGAMVVEAVLAADALRHMGVAARVLNLHTVEPLDIAALIAA
ncbi:MAG: hypothetical protein H7245_25675 [Candidatus Saccharibacteria bacterium]|nr:hypothetical protein [Pseudorhodobacter sp.]